ncbi:MAG: hypothetical protein U9Q12_01190 [Patescibacteria group bacterium]|nr:hypothetical protein [Patescibacteria group bacterium]
MIKKSMSIVIVMMGVFMIAQSSFAIVPGVCTEEYMPVCGQPPMPECPEGVACMQVMPQPQTYSNQCMMQQADAVFIKDGPCEDEVGIDCPNLYAPVCGEVGAGVRCIKAPCPTTQQQTFSNACVANNAGAKILHQGECNDDSTPTVNIQPHQVIFSPLRISGNSNGAWYGFEGNLGTVEVQDDVGNVLAIAGLPITGEWMTEEPVNFTAVVKFDAGNAVQGKLVFKNDNPSDNRELDKSFEVPVRFSPMNDVTPLEMTEPTKGCVRWFDGCNICTSGNGNINKHRACTEMACMEQKEPYCMEYASEISWWRGMLNRISDFVIGLF